jgi:hypothetical protein
MHHIQIGKKLQFGAYPVLSSQSIVIALLDIKILPQMKDKPTIAASGLPAVGSGFLQLGFFILVAEIVFTNPNINEVPG